MQEQEGSKEEISDEKAFEKYFNDSDLFELFKFSDKDECDTLNLVLKKDGFNYEKTPTNVRHIEDFLYKQKAEIKGISLNSNLYTHQDENEKEQSRYKKANI